MTVLPIALVAITGMLALVMEILHPRRDNNAIVVTSIVGLLLAGGALMMNLSGPTLATGFEMIVHDALGSVLQFVILVATLIVVLFSDGYLREKRVPFGEFYPMLLWATCGGMIMCSTKNLLMVFLGLEILSISLYVLAGLSRSENKSEESALKYFLLGAFASGFFLYGIAFLYGASGSLNLDDIKVAWYRTHNGGDHVFFLVGLGLMLIGLSFKAAFVPFHQWTPDVYQGAPTNVSAFMAAVSKVAAIATLIRVLTSLSFLSSYFIPVLGVIAVLTMTVGNLTALLQKDVKRTLGYSSIAHAGYILVGILAMVKLNAQGQTIAYYLLSYSLMTVGAFAVITLAAKEGKEGTKFSDLFGLWKRNPVVAIGLLVCVVSLLGIPPTAGFFGKFMIFQDAVKADLSWLAYALAINSIISLYYYLGIARAVFVVEDEEAVTYSKPSPALGFACAICAAGVILVGLLGQQTTKLLNLQPESEQPYKSSAKLATPTAP